MAFFEETDDIALLHQMTAEVAPRAKRMVGRYLAGGTEEAIPPPADVRAAREPASREQATATVRNLQDFPLFQALARTIGRRIEAIEISASAEFPEGVRVRVPEQPKYPRSGRVLEGTVEDTGTTLQVLLDNGDTWSGPASLAELVTSPG
jgi:hypothetical protein